MSDPVESFLDSQRPMLKVVDEILDEWKGEGCYQVPTLLIDVGIKLNWDNDTIRRNDPIVRAYLKDHPLWYVRRGAAGGVMKRVDYEKQEAAKVAKEKAKLELKALVAAKVAQNSNSSPTLVADTSDTDE